jgi:hypothetical protein
MSILTCTKCGATWEGSGTPTCPNCLAQHWSSLTGMIRPKHDSTNLPSASNQFRSVLPAEFANRADEYYRYAAYSGTALYSDKHNKPCYVVGAPAYLPAGSAIPPGSAMPTYPLNAFLVADPYEHNAHIYAEGQAEISAKISQGEYTYLGTCEKENCDNLRLPGEKFCAKHTTPPRASE